MIGLKEIKRFDSIVHQILAHDPKFSTTTITSRFIDGLKMMLELLS